MNKSEICRETLHYNFLKKIIIRFDYDGMDEAELDRMISDISMELKNHDYVDRTIESATEVGMQYDDPESMEDDGIYDRKNREQKLYVFYNQNPQVKLKISSSCACITIEKSRYVDCLTYCHVLEKVMTIISSSEKVPFFRYTRFGLRKINQCFLMDIRALNQYFEPSHFRIFRLQDSEEEKEKVMQLRDSFELADYNMNLVRTVIRGEIGGQNAYQVNYDADIYLIDQYKIKELVQEGTKIEEMNNWLFEVYKDAVTEEFLNQLIEGNFDGKMILGVDANGEDTTEDTI